MVEMISRRLATSIRKAFHESYYGCIVPEHHVIDRDASELPYNVISNGRKFIESKKKTKKNMIRKLRCCGLPAVADSLKNKKKNN